MKTITLKHALPLIALMLVCFALLPRVQAVGPDTEGAIAGSNNGEGIGVLVSRTTGIWNTGTGFEALNALTAGNQNTATGLRALFSDINGGFNTATGVYALYSNTAGFFNTATGAYSLTNNTDGSQNTANGYSALYFNSEGERNTATGFAALYQNTTGRRNTATGDSALVDNTTGESNTAIGVQALQNNITGGNNTANGGQALNNNTTGSFNTANGWGALFNNTAGLRNTATGYSAGNSITGDGNVCIGESVSGVAGVNDTTWIRNVNTMTQNFSAGVNDYVTVRLSDGRLGHTAVVSSQRYKEDIKPLAAASQALFALKPVSFRLKKEFDPTQAVGFGLIAEEVEKVDPDLVYRNDKGQVESVRYEMVNAMLLSEFLKEHKTVQEQGATIAKLQKQIEALTAGLQRVSDELELNKPAPRTVVHNQ